MDVIGVGVGWGSLAVGEGWGWWELWTVRVCHRGFWVCDIPWVTADCMRVRRGGLSAGGQIDDGGGGVVEINDEVADLVRDGDWWE